MEFCEEFALIEGSLISVAKALGNLKTLSLEKGDNDKINAAIDAVHKTIIRRRIQPENELNNKQCQRLRKIHLFLVLNTNLDIQNLLMDDINCGHIVNCAPNLSKDLLMELVWKIPLHKYMYETIIHCPMLLGAELLDALLLNLNTMELFQALPRVEQLSKTIFCKYMQLELLSAANSSSKSKLYTCFSTLLQYFVKPNVSKMSNMKNEELYQYAGFAMKHILTLMNNCISLYMDPSAFSNLKTDVYEITLPDFCDTGETKPTESVDFINDLLSVCKLNFCAVTVDIWLSWEECEINENGSTKSLQNIISISMYQCSEKLKKVKMIFPLAEEIISMFSSMAVKPRDEDDEIKDADIELIIQNVSDKTKSQKKWFKAFIENEEILLEEKCINCLKNNLHLADYDDVKLILNKIVQTLESESGDERLKDIGLESVKHFTLKKQVELVQWYFETFGISSRLVTDTFHFTFTETFNKAVDLTEKKDKFFSEFVHLTMQSPVEVISKALHDALMNSKQIPLIIDILKCLYPVCNLYEEQQSNESNKITLIISLLSTIMKENLNTVEISNFVHFVNELVDHKIIDGHVFVTRNLLPTLCDSLNTRNWSMLLLWLQTLHMFIDCSVKNAINIHLCPLLMMLAQVLEISRWNVLTFSIEAAFVCEETIVIVKKALKIFLDPKLTEDNEVMWLRMKLPEYLSPLNLSYFNGLWTKFEKQWTKAVGSIDTLLLDILQSNDTIDNLFAKTIDLFQDIENKHNILLFSLSKLLPLCTTNEWKVMVKKLQKMKKFLTNKPDSPVLEANLFADSILLLICVINKQGIQENEFTLACLDYSVRNLGKVLKEDIVPKLKHRHQEEQVKVVIKMVHVLGRLPQSIKNSCSILIVNVMIELLPLVFNYSVSTDEENEANNIDKETVIKQITTAIGILGDGDPLQILAKKLLECVMVNGEQ